jgi:hypothetical protein
MLPIMIDIRPARSRQSIPIARLEQRFRRARVGACDGFGRGVVDVVVLVDVAVGGEEEVPGPFAVHEVGRFDDAFVRGAFVVEDCCGGAEEGDAVVAEALDAQGGGDYWGDCEVLGQMRSGWFFILFFGTEVTHQCFRKLRRCRWNFRRLSRRCSAGRCRCMPQRRWRRLGLVGRLEPGC